MAASARSQRSDEPKDPKTLKLVWAHHPRGGRVEGFASEIYKGVYGKERKICVSPKSAEEMNGMSFPDKQVHLL